MRKLVEWFCIFLLGALSLAGILFLSFPLEKPPDTTDVWYKLSSEDPSLGQIALDMTRGYSYSDLDYVFLVVKDAENDDHIVIAFPNGGYWKATGYSSYKGNMSSREGSTEWKKE